MTILNIFLYFLKLNFKYTNLQICKFVNFKLNFKGRCFYIRDIFFTKGFLKIIKPPYCKCPQNGFFSLYNCGPGNYCFYLFLVQNHPIDVLINGIFFKFFLNFFTNY